MPLQEISAALWSSTLISPCMMVIDLTLHRRHQHTEPVTTSFFHTLRDLRMGRLPLVRPLLAIHGVYFLTFGMANLTEYYQCSSLTRMGLTTAVNVVSMSYKDRLYASLYGTTTISPRLPWTSRVLSTTGALVTMYAQFLQQKPLEHRMTERGISSTIAPFLSSAITCALAQIVSTPLHLLSIDLYRYPTHSPIIRLQRIAHAYMAVCTGRMLRILPAFGGGGYLNDHWKCHKFYDATK